MKTTIDCPRAPVRWARSAAFLALTLLTLPGCGNLTVGGLGEANVSVSGDDEPSSPSPAPAPATSWASAQPASLAEGDEDEPEGEVEVEFTLYLVSESGVLVQLGDEEMRVRVDVQGETEADVVERQPIPTDHYVELLIVFTEVFAEIESGLVIDGLPIEGEIDVELDDVELPVSRTVDLDVGAGGSVELVVDLNAPAWLLAVNPITMTVDVAVFEGLLGVRVR